MTRSNIIDLSIIAALILFLTTVIPATFRMYEDAKFNVDVRREFRAHGVKL